MGGVKLSLHQGRLDESGIRGVSIVDVLERFEIQLHLRRGGQRMIGQCPIHKGKANDFIVNILKNTWECRGRCHVGGGVKMLVQKLAAFDGRLNADLLESLFPDAAIRAEIEEWGPGD